MKNMGSFRKIIEVVCNAKRGKEQFNISELARIFNITSETLRKYEKKNIIEPIRLDNSYRVYSSWDITKIIRARQLRMEGNSLNEVNENLYGIDFMEDIQRIENREEEIREEIESRRKLLSWLNHRKETIKKYNDRKDKLTIEKHERIYCCIFMVENTLTDKSSDDLKELQKWLDCLPYTSVYYIGSSNYKTVSVIGVSESQRKEYHLEHLKADFIIPESDYVVYNDMAQHNKHLDTSNETIDRGYELMKKHGYDVEDLYVIKMINYYQKDGLYTSCNEMMFPLK